MHQPGPDAERNHVGKDVFHVDPHQRQKRKQKVSVNDDHADTKPTPFFSKDVPKCFLREKGSWFGVSMVIIFGHFLLPFLALLRIDVKNVFSYMVPLCIWAWLM